MTHLEANNAPAVKYLTIALDRLGVTVDKTSMAEKLKKPDSVTSYKIKRDMLLAALPRNDFNVAAAARQACYKDNYIRSGLNQTLAKDPWFQAQLEKLKAEHLRSNDDKVAAADRKLENLIDGVEMTPSVMIKALELFYRRNGALADKQIIESADRERELTATAHKEARRLSLVLMKQPSKPDDTPSKAG